jgi:hypothetical protein
MGSPQRGGVPGPVVYAQVTDSQQWEAFPVMRPRVDLPPVKISDGLYYANGFEP